jgi:ABC-2 type transport system permease protein
MAFTASPLSSPVIPESKISAVRREVRKWGRMFGLYVQDALAYRAVAIIWILSDTVPSILSPLLWLSAFNGRQAIGGFAPSQMTAYYLILLAVSNMVQCHQMWEIGSDIKEGRFSAYLIRPFSYGLMNYLSFAAWRLMRTILFLPIFGLALLLFGHTLHWSDMHLNAAFFLSIALGHLVSFSITYAYGLLALYFVETRSLFNVWYMFVILFSGQLAPLALFPPALRTVAYVLPFRYTVALPTEILLGRLTAHQVAVGILLQVVWILAGWAIGRVLWTFGVRRFTGVGL